MVGGVPPCEAHAGGQRRRGQSRPQPAAEPPGARQLVHHGPHRRQHRHKAEGHEQHQRQGVVDGDVVGRAVDGRRHRQKTQRQEQALQPEGRVPLFAPDAGAEGEPEQPQHHEHAEHPVEAQVRADVAPHAGQHLGQGGVGRVGIEEEIAVKIVVPHLVQRAVRPKVEKPGQAHGRKAQHAAQHHPAEAFPVPAGKAPGQQHQGHRPEGGAEVILDPEHRAAQKAQGEAQPQSERAAQAQRFQPQHHPAQQQGQAELLGAVALLEGDGGIAHRQHQRGGQRGRPARAAQKEQPPGEVQKQRRRGDLDEPDAQKAVRLDPVGDAVQEKQQRALLVHCVHIEHPPLGHGLAHQKEALSVRPVVHGIEGRTAADHGQHARGGQQQPECRKPAQRAGLPFRLAGGIHSSPLPRRASTFTLLAYSEGVMPVTFLKWREK